MWYWVSCSVGPSTVLVVEQEWKACQQQLVRQQEEEKLQLMQTTIKTLQWDNLQGNQWLQWLEETQAKLTQDQAKYCKREPELRDIRNHMEEMNTKITKMAHMNKQIKALEEFMNDMQNQHKRKRRNHLKPAATSNVSHSH